MLVCFKVNLGSVDAERHGLDYRKCQKGMQLDCKDIAATWLIAKGIATEVVVEAVAKPAAIQAITAVQAVPEVKVAPLSSRIKQDKTPIKES